MASSADFSVMAVVVLTYAQTRKLNRHASLELIPACAADWEDVFLAVGNKYNDIPTILGALLFESTKHMKSSSYHVEIMEEVCVELFVFDSHAREVIMEKYLKQA
jgi:hypothetical protein